MPSAINGYVFLSLITAVICKQEFYLEPEDIVVNPDENVIMTCKVNNREGECTWVKDSSVVGKIRNKYIYEREPVNDDCSLQILKTNLDLDDATWQCQVAAARLGESTITSKLAKLTVREEPLPPNIEDNTVAIPNGGKFTVREGDKRNIHCISRKGNPPAIIKWFIDDVDVTNLATQTNMSDVQKAKTYQATSVLTYTFNKDHNGRTLKCTALHYMYPEKSRASEITLDVMYAPVIELKNKPEDDIVEGMSLDVQCVADGNPQADVMWKKAGDAGYYYVGEMIRFPRIERKDSGIYSCSAKNPVGTSLEMEVSIDVKYPPRILSVYPSTVQTITIGSQTNFTCVAEGNPTPRYSWIQKWPGNPPRYLHRSDKSNFLIRNTTYDYQGKYVCAVENQIKGNQMKTQSQEISIDVKGPPQVLSSSERTKRKVIVEEEEDVMLTVFFCSDPPPLKTFWEWGSIKLSVGKPRGRFVAEQLLKDQGYNDCFEARLNIHKATSSDARKYMFNVQNEQGKDVYTISLEVRAPVAMSMVLGIVVGCIILLVIVILLVLYSFKTEKCCFKRTGTHNFKTDPDRVLFSDMEAGNTDTARTTASGAIPPDAVYTQPTIATTTSTSRQPTGSNGHTDNGHYENIRTDHDERRNNDGLVYADLDLKPLDRKGPGSGGRGQVAIKSAMKKPEREQIEYAEIQFNPKMTERADL